MSNDSKINMTETVMSLIKEGQVKMKPKWYFILGSLAMVGGLAGLTILSVFTISLITFSLRTHGPMGAVRYEQLISTFPWGAVVAAIIGIGLGIWLMRKYDFSYRKNFSLMIVGFVVTILSAGWFIDYTGLDNVWMKRGPLKEFYQRYDGGMMGLTIAANIDRHFIEQMIPHHDDAILMAEIAFTKAESSEIRTLAANIKRTQTEENAKMREWYTSWFGTDVPENTLGMGMGGGMMKGGVMGNATDMVKLELAKPFDKEFIEQMIPHHQMAVMMAQMLSSSTDRPEMKQLAEDIISAQTNEINQMREWYYKYSY